MRRARACDCFRGSLSGYPGYPGCPGCPIIPVVQVIPVDPPTGPDEKIHVAETLVRPDTQEKPPSSQERQVRQGDSVRPRFGCVVSFVRSKSGGGRAGSAGDQRENKMQESDVRCRRAFPSARDPPRTVHPTMRSLEHPPASLVSSLSLELAYVLAAAGDVTCKVEFSQ
jgi:hypothetical protein